MEENWKKIVVELASAVASDCDLPAEALALLTPQMRPEEYILELSRAERRMDAAMVMAHVLPRREAVWWACMCAQNMQIMASEKGELLALTAAEKWVYEPTEANRGKAFQVAQESKLSEAGTLCSLAVAISGETMPLGPDQSIELDSSAFPGLVFGIVVMAASEGDGRVFDQRLQESLLRGQEIACGGNGKLGGKQGASTQAGS